MSCLICGTTAKHPDNKILTLLQRSFWSQPGSKPVALGDDVEICWLCYGELEEGYLGSAWDAFVKELLKVREPGPRPKAALGRRKVKV